MSIDQNLSQLGRDIGRTVQRVLSEQNFAELKNTIEDVVVRQTNVAVTRANQAVQRAVDKAQRPVQPAANPVRPARPQPRKKQTVAGADNSLWMRLPAVRKRENGWGLAAMLAGIIGAFPTGIVGLVGLISSLGEGNLPAALIFAFSLLLPCLLCVVLAVYGKKRRLRFRRFERYLQVFENKSYCQVSRLAQAVGASEGYVVRDLNAMVRARMFLEGYFDDKKTTFMADFQIYRRYLELRQNLQQQARQREEQRQPQSDMDRALADVQSYLNRLHQLNVAMPMEEISLRLDGLEEIITKIFEYVSQHPEKLSDIRQFGAYYLPTTVKLVEAYQELEAHRVKTTAVNQTKDEILEALGKINLSLQALFDELLEDDLLDVSTEISALQAMLAQEGLSGDGSPFSGRTKEKG